MRHGNTEFRPRAITEPVDELDVALTALQTERTAVLLNPLAARAALELVIVADDHADNVGDGVGHYTSRQRCPLKTRPSTRRMSGLAPATRRTAAESSRSRGCLPRWRRRHRRPRCI